MGPKKKECRNEKSRKMEWKWKWKWNVAHNRDQGSVKVSNRMDGTADKIPGMYQIIRCERDTVADISLIKTDSVSEEFYSVDGIYTRRSVYEVKSISRFCRSSSSPHCQPQKSLQKSQCEALQVHAWTARIVAVAISSTISSPQYGVPYLSRELVRSLAS